MRLLWSVMLPITKIWPINMCYLHIQDSRHQYVTIHHISVTSHYTQPSLLVLVKFLETWFT